MIREDSTTMMEEAQTSTTADEAITTESSPLLLPPAPITSTRHDNEGHDHDGDDQEKGCTACCRICLESECSSTGDELISPCICRGTQQFVHRECLDHWRSVKEGFAFSHCTTCKAQFHLTSHIPEDYSWRKLKFRFFVARDIILVFLTVQATIAVFAGLAYVLDLDGQFRKSFSSGWDRVLSRHPIPFYYCAGVFMFFVIIGIGGLVVHLTHSGPCTGGCRPCCYGWGTVDCFPVSVEACGALLVIFVVLFAILGIAYGLLAATMALQRIWQRHYHILTKRELTKEYVVEDLNGVYTVPTLSPEHEARLKALKLL